MAKRKNDADAAGPSRHAARLETMANLARPVQHEINNLLTVIFANLEMLKRTAAEGAPQRQLDRVNEAARRFEASCRGFLSLSRRPVPGVSVFALEEALGGGAPAARGADAHAVHADGGAGHGGLAGAAWTGHCWTRR